jgi:hypothetical protein
MPISSFQTKSLSPIHYKPNRKYVLLKSMIKILLFYNNHRTILQQSPKNFTILQQSLW